MESSPEIYVHNIYIEVSVLFLLFLNHLELGKKDLGFSFKYNSINAIYTNTFQ